MTLFPKRRALWLGAFALLPVTLAGCGHTNSATDNAATNAIVPMNANDTVATVGGSPIAQSTFFTQLQNFSPNPQQPQTAAAGRSVLSGLINGLCFEQMAQEKKVAPTDAEVNAQYDNLKMTQDTSFIKSLEDRLHDLSMTPDDLKDTQIRPQLAQLKLLTAGQAAPTDTEIKAFYDQNKDKQFTKPARAHLRAIVLPTKDEAAGIYKQIQGGAKFDTFLSKSLNKQTPDGDLQQWVATDPSPNPQQAAVLQNLTSAAAKTPIGQTAAPFALQTGQGAAFFLVQVVERKPKEIVPYETAKPLIPFDILVQKAAENQAGFQTLQQQERDYQAKLAADGKITISLPGAQYQALMTDLKTPPPPAPTMPPQFAPPSGPQGGAPAPQGSAPPPGRPMPTAPGKAQ